jgi:hypothetical protein
MFTIRVHQPNVRGHAVFECNGYRVVPNGQSTTIVMAQGIGDKATEKSLLVPEGGLAYVMGDSGKTVEVIRTTARPAQLRGVR